MTEEVKLRVRQTPVQPVAAPVRLRERPFDPYAWMKPPPPSPRPQGYRDIAPPLPTSWDSGTALMRGPSSKGFKRHITKPGYKDEENPNLLGRAVRRNDGQYWVWAWRKGEYVYVGLKSNTGDAFAALLG